MFSYSLKRLLSAVPTLFLLVTLAFFLMHAAPGGPFDRERTLPPEIERALRAEFHLDEPILRQYLRYLGGLAHGDLGPSFQYQGFRVAELIGSGAPQRYPARFGPRRRGRRPQKVGRENQRPRFQWLPRKSACSPRVRQRSR